MLSRFIIAVADDMDAILEDGQCLSYEGQRMLAFSLRGWASLAEKMERGEQPIPIRRAFVPKVVAGTEKCGGANGSR